MLIYENYYAYSFVAGLHFSSVFEVILRLLHIVIIYVILLYVIIHFSYREVTIWRKETGAS